MAPHGAAAPAKDVIDLSSSLSDGGGDGMVGEEEVEGRSHNDEDEDSKKKTTKKEKEKSREGEKKKRSKKKDTVGAAIKKEKMGSNAASSSSSSSPTAVGETTTGGASCSFPMSRVWRLVRSEGGNTTTTATRTTPDAIFLINKASEMFLQLFAEDAFANATTERKKYVSYKHLSSTVHDAKRYEFLSDFVPEKVRAEDALNARALVET